MSNKNKTNLYFINEIWKLSSKNKYAIWYLGLALKISNRGHQTKKQAQAELGYVESHHILPVSFDSSHARTKTNKLHCTAREHFLMHFLMVKMFDDKRLQGLSKSAIRAFTMCSRLQERKITSRAFEALRKICSEALIGNRYGSGSKGTTCYNNGTTLLYLKPNDAVPEGFSKGNLLSNTITITNGDINTKWGVSESIPEGWWRGSCTKGRQSPLKGRIGNNRKDESYREKISIANSNKIWITDGIINKRLNSTDAVPTGWNRGRSGNNFSYKICPHCGRSVDHGNYPRHIKSCGGNNGS